jgi:hypothetical protein
MLSCLTAHHVSPLLLPAALHLAADAGQCDSVSRLVALGAPVDVTSNKGLTPLALALMKVGGCGGTALEKGGRVAKYRWGAGWSLRGRVCLDALTLHPHTE